jgi:hypothetical protein
VKFTKCCLGRHSPVRDRLENRLVDWEVFRAQYMAGQTANRCRRVRRGRLSDSVVDDMAVVAGAESLLDVS